MLRLKALPRLLAVTAAASCLALSGVLAFALPRDATLLTTASAALQLPFGSGLLLAAAICFASGAKQIVSRSFATRAWIQGTAEVAALLATFAALGSTLKIRQELRAQWAAVWWTDQHVMFFMAAAVLYAAVALLARHGSWGQYAAALAVLAAPVPFLFRALLPPVCTLYSKAPPLPSVLAAFIVALVTGLPLAACAIFARTRIAHSNSLLQALAAKFADKRTTAPRR